MIKLIIAFFLFTIPAYGHDWYPENCCSNKDCKPVECSQLVEMDYGSWKYIPTGNVFPKHSVSLSKDSKCHVCINAGKSECAFIIASM